MGLRVAGSLRPLGVEVTATAGGFGSAKRIFFFNDKISVQMKE